MGGVEPEFRDSTDTPVFQADGLYDVQIDGPNCWFLLFDFKRTAGGIVYREPAFWARLPTTAVGPGIALTIRSLGKAMFAPAATTAERNFPRDWVH